MEKAEIDPFITSYVDHLFESMQEDVRKGQDVEPEVAFLARQDGGNALVPVLGLSPLFSTKEGKAKMRATVKKIWGQLSADQPQLTLLAVVMASDAWIDTPSPEEHEKILQHGRVGPFPHKQEVLLVNVSLADREIHYHLSYRREGKEVVFAENRTTAYSQNATMKGLLVGLWPL